MLPFDQNDSWKFLLKSLVILEKVKFGYTKAMKRMTLIIYVRCKDGCILISDRQASEWSGESQEDTKTFISRAHDFAIGGTGIGFDVIHIFGRLTQDDNINGSNIVKKLYELLETYSESFSNTNVSIRALLVTREKTRFVPYEIVIHGDQFYVNPITVRYRCCGLKAAKIIANYFLKRKKLDEVPWNEAVLYVIATMKEVGKEVDGVGRLEEFGFDVTVMLDDGYVYVLKNYRDDNSRFAFDLQIREDISSKFNKITGSVG